MKAPKHPERGVDFADPDGVTRIWPVLPVILTFAACFCVMTWPWLSGRVTIPWDSKAHFQPQIQFLADSLSRGEWPLWNPYVFSGQPQISDPQSMIFSPPFLLLAFLNSSPSLWAADLTVLGAMFVGGVALITWFRDRGWHWAGALLAALVFSFGAAMAWRIQHTGQVLSLAYLPVALLCVDRALARGSVLYGIAAGITGAFIVLGRDQVALLCIYLLAVYVIWQLTLGVGPRVSIAKQAIVLGAGAIVGLAIVVVPVLLTVLLAAESNRPAIDFIGAGRGSLHPALLMTFLLPEVFGAAGDMKDYWGPPSFAWRDTDLFIAQNVGQLYVGAIPFILITGALFAGRLWLREIRFFLFAFVVMMLYALGWYTPAFRAMYEVLPGVNLYRRPADAVFLIGALGGILAGYAAHLLFTEPWQRLTRRQWLWVAGVIGAAVVAAVGAGIGIGRLARLPIPLAVGALFCGGAILALIWARTQIALQPWLAALVLAGFTTIDLAWNNGPSTSSAMPPAHYDVLQPSTRNETIALLKSRVAADQSQTHRDRIEFAGVGFHWPNASMTHRLENTLGFNPVRLGIYSQATGAEDHVGLPDQRKFAPLMPSYRSLLADLLGLRFIAAGAPVEQIDPKLNPGDLTFVARTVDAYIYENPRTLPRALFANEARQVKFDELLKTGAWPDFDPKTTVLFEEQPATSPRRQGRSAILSYAINEIVIRADSPDGGWVILNDIWQPWWFATVDGRDAQVMRANVLFRAVEVPPGQHTVHLRFQPLRGAWAALRSRRAK